MQGDNVDHWSTRGRRGKCSNQGRTSPSAVHTVTSACRPAGGARIELCTSETVTAVRVQYIYCTLSCLHLEEMSQELALQLPRKRRVGCHAARQLHQLVELQRCRSVTHRPRHTKHALSNLL